MLDPQSTINCRGRLLSLQGPRIMGILNVTPDSFYDGGRYDQLSRVLRRTEQMLEAGAAIIDVGGMSSRPGAEMISVAEEQSRVVPAVEAIVQRFPEAILSVDTFRAPVAREAVAAGVGIVNDISAGRFDPELLPTVASLGAPYILMHMRGTLGKMPKSSDSADVVRELLDFFIAKVGALRALGVKDILLDPGFGFGKSRRENYQLLRRLHVFRLLDLPVLTGVSRKSMIYRTLGVEAGDALNGTTALHMVALQQGSRLLRVHDVEAAQQVIRLWEELERAAEPENEAASP